jgi:RHS repeat-associated protein
VNRIHRTIAIALLLLTGARVVGAQPANVVVEYYHTDALGSVRAVSDPSGTVTAQHDYFPFGEEYAASSGSDSRRFTGKERDIETGLDYFGGRSYSAKLGRFAAVDPQLNESDAALNPQKWNRYAYARSNPLAFVDPDGRDALWIAGPKGTTLLVIPVKFVGASATEANVSSILSKANNLSITDPNVRILVIQTSAPIAGVLNTLDFSPGLDAGHCGAAGECVYPNLGSDKAHINSAYNQATDAAAHDTLHFAGIRDRYKEGPRDANGNRTSTPTKGYTNGNVMTSRSGSDITADQVREARKNPTTKSCSAKDGELHCK